jgi:UMF1 family MFS transporter
MFKFKNLSKTERSWILYDVANSAYILTVITVLFPILHQAIAADEGRAARDVSSTFMYLTAGIALVVAIISPIIGSVANYEGNKKKFFRLFLIIAIIGGIGISIPGWSWVVLLALFAVSSIGYSTTNVIYDAFLVDVTEEDRMDEISSLGFAWGYIGSMIPFFIGIIPFALVTFGMLDDQWFNLSITFAFVIAMAWWIYYSLPLLRDVDQKYALQSGEENEFKLAMQSLGDIFKDWRKYKHIIIYLLAYLLYIDVVNSVIRLATTIGTDLNVGNTVLLGVIVIVQFVAFPCAILFGKLTKRFGAKRMLFYGIFMYALTILVVWQIRENTAWLMFVVAALVGSAQGGIQAISRSYFARMVPTEKANEFFGFFSVFSRFAGIFSPFLLASLYQIEGMSVNTAVLFLIVPLSMGAILLAFVPDIRTKGESA